MSDRSPALCGRALGCDAAQIQRKRLPDLQACKVQWMDCAVVCRDTHQRFWINISASPWCHMQVASQSRDAVRENTSSRERSRAAQPELHDLRLSSQVFGPRVSCIPHAMKQGSLKHSVRSGISTNCCAGLDLQGMLLIGFSKADGTAVEAWMLQMEPTFIVSHCTAAMLDATLDEAVSDRSSGGFWREPHARVDEVLPRLVLLSGMTGEESVAIAEHWERFTGEARTARNRNSSLPLVQP